MSLSGSVTLANTRLSLANGYAFFDTSAANADYANNINSQIEVTSVTTGKKAIGYIKAVGTGETYGAELVTNGDFASDVAGWNVTAPTTIAWNAGGYADIERANGNGLASQTITAAAGILLKGSMNTIALSNGVALRYISNNFFTASGTGSASGYIAAPTANGSVAIAATNNVLATCTVDDVSFKQVLTPSATGVTITSTPNGSTYNWASIESGFNYNDALGYTWKIIPHTRFSRGRRRYIDVYGIERTVFYK